MLKPQDILILLKIQALAAEDWSYRSLSASLFLSLSEVHDGIKRAAAVHLYNERRKRPARRALLEFLVHGVKYVYPPQRGGLTLGTPTCYAAPPLNHVIVQPNELPPVWPDEMGERQGYAFSPLYRSVPQAARADPKLYEMLTLVDAIRDGRAREVELAIRELKVRLEVMGEQRV